MLVLAFLLATGRDEPLAPTASGSEPGIAHVHGLGVNPANDELQVATHYGSFTIPADGSAERVGASYQDTMGFTVVGPDHFYGSGHPDVAGIRKGQPGLLGLIESTDAGATWESVSLSGEVDFHGLVFDHDRVYGWDATSGRFMVSDETRTWETRSTIDLASFAVDPSDADHVVAASASGLVDSADGGRTWSIVDGPEVVTLSWDRAAGLWGVTADGSVHGSRNGSEWEEVGSLPGPPQALLAAGDVLYAAAEEGDVTGIYRSDDGGRSWQLQYRDAR
ncbi:MAG: exo-alpha-sialidase [Actinomycetota bacterium]|nr:exo-alpha-sialidase [Actinomycetota bacterium]